MFLRHAVRTLLCDREFDGILRWHCARAPGPRPNNQSILKNVLAAFDVVGCNRNRRLRKELLEAHKAQSTAADIYDIHDDTRYIVGYDVSSNFSARNPGLPAPIDRLDCRVIMT